jgi:hypothetical protein
MLKSIFGPTGVFKSLTFYGVVTALTGVVVGHYDPNVSPAVANGVQIAGLVVTTLGLRRAHNKAVAEIADLITQLAARR